MKPEPVRKHGQRWTRAFLDQLPIEERLMGLKPQELLDQFDPKQIEEYLEQLKRKKE